MILVVSPSYPVYDLWAQRVRLVPGSTKRIINTGMLEGFQGKIILLNGGEPNNVPLMDMIDWMESVGYVTVERVEL